MSDVDRMKQVPLNNQEIDVVIHLLKQSVPPKTDEEIVWNVINRLLIIRRL